MKNKTLLYRWISSENLSFGSTYINLTSSLKFAGNYGDIILVYELQSNNFIEELIIDRQSDVRVYDEYIQDNGIDGYRWKISDTGIYHYRAKKSSLRLVKIIYLEEDIENTVSALTRFNRKYCGLNQTEFSEQTWIPRVKISEYENAVREPSLEKIAILSSLIDIPQELSVWGGKVIFKK